MAPIAGPATLTLMVLLMNIGQSDNPRAMSVKEGIALSDEKKLIKHLLGNYTEVGVVGRPVYNTTDKISVSYGLALIQILDLDEKNQVLTTNCWSRYSWTDILLKWDPEEYGGVDHVRVPINDIWIPDIVLYNYADTRLEEKREVMAVVQHTGGVLWIPPAIYKSSCKIDITHFPFDKQSCLLKFGSWTYDGFKLDIDFFDGKAMVDLSDYVESNEWTVLGAPAKKNIKKYPCCDEPYPDLTFTVNMKRQPAFYNYILILPCVLLSSLTLVLFWLPPESPAKMVLGMNIFVAFFLLLLLLADVTPPAATEIPQIGAYYCLNMAMITLSTFLSVIVINLYFRGDKRNRVPAWLKRIFLDFFARLFCMRSDMPPKEHDRNHARMEQVRGDGKGKSHKKIKCPELKYNKFQMYDVFRDGAQARNHTESTSPDKSPIHLSHSLESDVKEIRRQLRTMLNRVHDKDAVQKIAQEWRTVALVLDRMFFFCYLTATVVSLATIFPRTS
ncbi:neuronal acetylcholine receptor subunit alpha-10-like isoform X2 [Lineus longissimus]|uniref:neuronal acetylcholine receptor subunit alpha-10-like isoform X2 n=1 Tax=Lineus longissimus TaxID=88925 RepID=UPI00315CB192